MFLTVWFFRIFLFFFFLRRIFVVFGVINMVLASFAEGGLLDHSIYYFPDHTSNSEDVFVPL